MIAVDSIFFDVDGTLVDSSKDIAKAMNFALKGLGLKEKSQQEIVSHVGTGVKYLVRKSLGTEDEHLIKKAVRIFSDYYVKHSADESRLYPHVKDMLDHFKEKRKFVLTNRYKKFAEATLIGLGIQSYFEDIIGGDDENCLKPSACVLDKVFSRLRISRGRAIIVGDMAIDVETGKNSGIKTCWVTYGLGKAEEVRPLGPDYVIDDMKELKEIIK